MRSGSGPGGPGLVRVVRVAKLGKGGTVFNRTALIYTYLDSSYQGKQFDTKIISL